MAQLTLQVIPVVLVLFDASATAQLAPNAPQDRPQGLTQDRIEAYRKAIAPYVETGRKTYPAAKERFLRGLPSGQTFFVFTRLADSHMRTEDVFVRVQRIEGGLISGLIASQIQLVEGFRLGQPYTFREDALLDWLISKPDGREEGNVVGKFLDTYHQ